ncbi:hypothetical protein BGZ63DRAFT_57380 [Mariannaea sp. PMI_226]|nr:hypothetical protein BGZ63DRAFT_57380 [Mariannaea sp. PMI_226]
MASAKSITVILSPYHLGAKNQAVGAGPTALIDAGLMQAIRSLGVPVHEVELDPVDHFDGEIARLFELLRRTSKAVTQAVDADSFPIIFSGNCSATVGVSAGISASKHLSNGQGTPSCVWFDAHDDYNTPDVLLSGYLDSMPVAMLEGNGWKTLLSSIPGFRPMKLKNDFVHIGLRDVTDVERGRVLEAGFPIVWGDTTKHVDFAAGLREILQDRSLASTMVHVDLDALDISVGQVNKFSALGGLMESDLVECLETISQKAKPVSLTVASYDPSFDKDGRIIPVAIRAVVAFLQSLVSQGLLVPQ